MRIALLVVLILSCAPPAKPSLRVCIAEGAGVDYDKPLDRCTSTTNVSLPLRFGIVPRDHDQSRRVQLTNDGVEPITIISLTLDQGVAYRLDEVELPLELKRGQTLDLEVVIDTTSFASTFATLAIEWNDPARTAVNVSISGALTDATDAPPKWAYAEVLPFDVYDAEYSRELDAIVLATHEGPMMIDLATNTVHQLADEVVTSRVSVSPSGHEAVFSWGDTVLVVNLDDVNAPPGLMKSVAAYDLVHGGHNFAYVLSDDRENDVAFHGVDLRSGIDVVTSGTGIRRWTRVKLYRTDESLYGADRSTSRSGLAKYSIAGGGPPTLLSEATATATHPTCGDLWLSDDKSRIFTKCGHVFSASQNQAEDMRYLRRLDGSKACSGSMTQPQRTPSLPSTKRSPSRLCPIKRFRFSMARR